MAYRRHATAVAPVLLSLVLLISLSLPTKSFSTQRVRTSRLLNGLRNADDPGAAVDKEDGKVDDASPLGDSRRDFFGYVTPSFLSLWSAPSFALPSSEVISEVDASPRGPLSALEISQRLSSVPTFTIVDTRGVPYMVVGDDAKLTCYFFTSYGEAERILKVARKSSGKARAEQTREIRSSRKAEGLPPLSKDDEAEELGPIPWNDARISSVPLDFAVSLASRRQKGVYFRVAPSEEDVRDALALDESEKDELAEGKVPLFYLEDFTLPSGADKSFKDTKTSELSPLYFHKSELLREWKKQRPKGKDVPNIKVTELFSVVNAMVLQGVSEDEAEDLRTLFFIPPIDSAARATECKKKGGNEKPFLLGERIIIL